METEHEQVRGRSSVEAYVGIAIAICTAVFAMTWWTKLLLLIVLSLICVDLIWNSKLTNGWPNPAKVIGTIICIFSLGTISYRPIIDQYKNGIEHVPSAKEIATELGERENSKTAVELECTMDSFPVHIAPRETAHLMLVNKKARVNSGLFDVFNHNDKETLWPRRDQLQTRPPTPNQLPNYGPIYRCMASNQGNTKLFDVALNFHLNYMTPAPSDKQVYPYVVVVNPLPPGSTFTFYIVNECPVGASVIEDNRYSAKILGDDTRYIFPLLRPDRNPVEQIMFLFPSSVSWTGEQCS